jgi:hypothetical protein
MGVIISKDETPIVAVVKQAPELIKPLYLLK